MRILMICWNSIVETDVISAFFKRGHHVSVWKEKINNLDYDKNIVRLLSETLVEKTYDMVFSIDFFPIVARVCDICKVYYVSWAVDCPVLQYYSNALLLPYNRVFLFDYAMYEELNKHSPKNTFYLPLGVNVYRNDEVIQSISEDDRRRFSTDISFIGSTYAEKCMYNEIEGDLSDWTRGYAESLINAQLLVYDGFFLKEACSKDFLKRFLQEINFGIPNEDYSKDYATYVSQFYLGEKVSEQERIRLLKRLSEKYAVDLYTMSDVSEFPKINYKGKAESKIEMPKIFHLTKINLNITSKTIQTGLPQRFWDILGAGGFLLTNAQIEIPEYLIPGEDLETYSSFEECEKKISYYLAHEEKRRKIAKNGYDKTRRFHTYEHRIQVMEKILYNSII